MVLEPDAPEVDPVTPLLLGVLIPVPPWPHSSHAGNESEASTHLDFRPASSCVVCVFLNVKIDNTLTRVALFF